MSRWRQALAGVVLLGALGCAMPAAAAEPATPAAPAAAAVALLRSRLATPPVLRGEFEQRKTIAGFRNPLVSRGEFIVAKAQGVWWHTREPFDSTLVLTRTRLLTRRADGGEGTALDAAQEPGLRMVNELVFALLAADLAALAERFELKAEPVGATGWRLELVPRDAALARVIRHATLEGERQVTAVRLEEARGDLSLIRFTRLAPAEALAPDDAHRFD